MRSKRGLESVSCPGATIYRPPGGPKPKAYRLGRGPQPASVHGPTRASRPQTHTRLWGLRCDAHEMPSNCQIRHILKVRVADAAMGEYRAWTMDDTKGES
jgi:hypothetical protein